MPSPQPSTPTRRARWTALAALVVVACVYLLTASRVDMDDANNDISSTAFGAWRIAESGQPWLNDESGRRYEPVPERSWVTTNPGNGREVMSRSPGVIAAVVPATVALRLFGMTEFGPGPEIVTAALLTMCAIALFFLAVRRDLGVRTAVLVAAALAFASPVWSVNANGMWPHVLTVLGIAGMAWAAGSERWWLVGLFGGVALWGRVHSALIVAVLGLGLAVLRRRPMIALRAGATSGAAMVLASLWSWWHYSSWVPSGGYGGGLASQVTVGVPDTDITDGVVVNQLGMWVSPAYGILIWTPVLLLVLPGVARRWDQIPDWARLLLVSGVLYTLVQAQLNVFTGGYGFYGYRHGLEFLACATPAVAYSLRGTGRITARAAAVVLSLQFAAIALGAVFDGGFIAPERAWRTNALVEIIGEAPVTGVLGLLLAAAALATGVALARRLPAVEHSPQSAEARAV